MLDSEYINEDIDAVPDVEADFVYWSKMPYWSLEESVALLLGKEPKSIYWDIVQHHLEWPFATPTPLNFA
jgi:hypothetical protein